MNNIKDESDGLKSSDIEYINEKRIVFIVDEAHRSTFGDMLINIKNTFPKAIFFDLQEHLFKKKPKKNEHNNHSIWQRTSQIQYRRRYP